VQQQAEQRPVGRDQVDEPRDQEPHSGLRVERARRLQRRRDLRREDAEPLLDHRREDRLASGKELVQRADAHPGARRDGVGGDRGETRLAQNPSARLHDRVVGGSRARLAGDLARLPQPLLWARGENGTRHTNPSISERMLG